jgi:hypothetical protein
MTDLEEICERLQRLAHRRSNKGFRFLLGLTLSKATRTGTSHCRSVGSLARHDSDVDQVRWTSGHLAVSALGVNSVTSLVASTNVAVLAGNGNTTSCRRRIEIGRARKF